ncbi:hypothetical protein KQX54_010356 [Cotesia glomerata]|uniref:Uncharacterized protein n=1 Tax=Cotesia glomerata TaxID=32391 RepID=A0AAV7IX80_COTGL|nr:hypothetical protein KQX54_010356 [Cotesia glomerata]
MSAPPPHFVTYRPSYIVLTKVSRGQVDTTTVRLLCTPISEEQEQCFRELLRDSADVHGLYSVLCSIRCTTLLSYFSTSSDMNNRVDLPGNPKGFYFPFQAPFSGGITVSRQTSEG